jgi:hypothetical protein
VPWDGAPRKQGECWRLSKAGKVAACGVFNHPFGWELRVHVRDELVRSEVFRVGDRCIDAMIEWRDAFVGKGWT